MPNRIIRESILTSPTVDAMTSDEERFFFRLMLLVDDFGRFDARPSVIRGRAYALKTDVSDADILNWLTRLAELDVVTVYEVRGKRFIWFVNWDAYQNRRAKDSKWPAPDEGQVVRPEDIRSSGNHVIASAITRMQTNSPDSSREQSPADVPVSRSRIAETETESDLVPFRSADADAAGDIPTAPSDTVPTDRPPAVSQQPFRREETPVEKPARKPRKPRDADSSDESSRTEEMAGYLAAFNAARPSPHPVAALSKAEAVAFNVQRKSRSLEDLLWVLGAVTKDPFLARKGILYLLSTEAKQAAAGLEAAVVAQNTPRPNRFNVAGENLDAVWED